MIRPHDQAKLLFLCFLRSSAALATTESSFSKSFTAHLTSQTSTSLASVNSNNPSSSSSSVTTPTNNSESLPILNGHISLRLATRTDVQAIQRCNLATLPENYSTNFYVNHMRRWPDLSLVVEHFPGNCIGSRTDGKARKRRNVSDTYDPEEDKEGGKIVGYVLGKVEECRHPFARPLSPSTVAGTEHENDVTPAPESLTKQGGHVTSLAILSPYRRRGLAALLMKQLHVHMKAGYGAESVGLHVRVSNVAARKLYCDGMGYSVSDVIQGYYQDGEDAFFMQKKLIGAADDALEEDSSMEEKVKENSLDGWRWVGGAVRSYWGKKVGDGSSIWEIGPSEFRLPRDITLPENEKVPLSLSSAEGEKEQLVNLNSDCPPSSSTFEESQCQVMTGSL